MVIVKFVSTKVLCMDKDSDMCIEWKLIPSVVDAEEYIKQKKDTIDLRNTGKASIVYHYSGVGTIYTLEQFSECTIGMVSSVPLNLLFKVYELLRMDDKKVVYE